ncbi:MAG: S-layer homology domain-containing protein, partial [Synergistaceae bacterium]|nr:S-layer homology domain-containing protein [Synergistaceae bacterium]
PAVTAANGCTSIGWKLNETDAKYYTAAEVLKYPVTEDTTWYAYSVKSTIVISGGGGSVVEKETVVYRDGGLGGSVDEWLDTTDHFAYIIGNEAGLIRPTANISRAEAATIFFRLLKENVRATYWRTDNRFSDVDSGMWYNNAVSTSAQLGILMGYPDGSFVGTGSITRAEFATIAARFLNRAYTGANRFTDIGGHWAAKYINTAAEQGWLEGYPDGTFRPEQPITRAEAVTVVNRMLGRDKLDGGSFTSDVKTWSDAPASAWYYNAIEEATNSHDYERGTDGVERWSKLNTARDWAALEKAWSTANSGK